MKTDISRLSFDELKHFLGVFTQMGRVQLDWEWNEQAELWLRLLQRQGADTARTGSPDHGFLIAPLILLDAMDVRTAWRAEAGPGDPAPHLAVDYFDHRAGAGSLTAEGAVALARAVERPLDLTGLAEVVFMTKGSFAAGDCVFFLGQGGTRAELATVEDPDPVAGWRVFRADPAALSAPIDLAAVDEYGFTGLDPTARYALDAILVDLPIRQLLVPTGDARLFDAAPPGPGTLPSLAIDDDERIWRSTSLRVSGASDVTYELPAVRDLSHVRRLVLAARSDAGAPSYDLTVVDASATPQEVTLGGATVTAAGGWEVRAYDLPQTGIDWTRVAALRWDALDASATYHVSPVLLEMELAGNLVIMGGDGTPEGAARFYADGLAAVKESHETYFNQRDLPEADAAPLQPPAEGKCRIDLAYLDVWERPITYIEDPGLREVALEGPDTATRTQLVAQVRVLPGAEVDAAAEPEAPLAAFDALPPHGRGALTTKDAPAATLDPCADPCEPRIAGTFTGQENRLFRVEVQRAGGIGAAADPGTAFFKWSRENGAAATPLIVDARAGAFSAHVEQPEHFREGDLVELSDDLADLITGPYTDRRQERGELRRITAIDLQAGLVSWEDATAPDPAFHAALARDYRLAHHARLRRWDGLRAATPGDIVLDDGVVIELGGEDLIPGDFWVFATRTADRSVERLIEAPPHGIRHRHYRLATIHRCTSGGDESVAIDDLRPTFDPLPRLRAADVAYDPGCWLPRAPEWADVTNVQEALDAICRLDLDADVKTHNRFLHGHGVVCGLKVKCNPVDRGQVVVDRGYALDCDGSGIQVHTPQLVELVERAQEMGLLDDDGNGEVCLTLGRGAAADATIGLEAHVEQGFWDGILEGTLLLDFYKECIESLLMWLAAQFLPFPATTVPVPESHKRLVSLLNLFYYRVNPTTGEYVFLSTEEDRLLREFYEDLRARLQSEAFCGMFDHAVPFPDYPYPVPPGIETAFGLWTMHTRVRIHPDGRFAYTCGDGRTIQVFDLEAFELVELLEFPAGENVEVRDVAFSGDGSELYAVATLDDDSIFATATIADDHSHAWGASQVVCGLEFVSLATGPAAPDTLYAIARALGFYVFDPHAVPVEPTAAVPFHATGLLRLSEDGAIAYAAEHGPSEDQPPAQSDFTRIRAIDVDALTTLPVDFSVAGRDADHDVLRVGDLLYVTGDAPSGSTRMLYAFEASSGAPPESVAAQVDLGDANRLRLTALPEHDALLISVGTQNRVARVALSTHLLDEEFAIPVQIVPTGIGLAGGGETIVVLNAFSNTLSVIDAATALDPTAPPAYTTIDTTPEAPVDELLDYRQDADAAYFALLKQAGQYLKDCFCEKFLVDCPECGPDDKVYLGCVEVREGRVYHVCNFTKRHYVKSFRTYGYWLSTVPVLPLVKRAFAEFCCLVLDPGS